MGNAQTSPVAFIVFLLAGWISRQQLIVIEYLKAENRMLRERLKGCSLWFSDRNPRWGYTRIQGALLNLGHEVGRRTIANVLRREGVEPAPDRGARTPWSMFLSVPFRRLIAESRTAVIRLCGASGPR